MKPLLGRVGDPEDLSAAYLGFVAERDGWRSLVLPEQTVGQHWWWKASDAGGYLTGWIEVGGERFPLDAFTGISCRLHPAPPVPEADLDAAEANWLVAERRHALVHFVSGMPCAVANRPRHGRANASKPFQMAELTRFGFLVPEWIATNVADEALDAARRWSAGAIYKSCSGFRSHVRAADDALFAHMREGTTPVIIQQRIMGHDVRVHVVGDKCFATAIHSRGGVDYRFDDSERTYTETATPDAIADLCVRHRRAEQLLIAGLDFRVAENGTWWCLESNPVPTFLPYEMSTGQPMAAAILREMRKGEVCV